MPLALAAWSSAFAVRSARRFDRHDDRDAVHPGDYPLKVLWTAHRTRTSDETFKFMCALVRRKAISRFVDGEPRRANGQQEIVFVNGSRIMFGVRENGFGRGFDSVDIEVFDEAQILTERALDDMIPATNAARNPLIAYMGTSPKPSDPSEVFSMRRDEALKGDSADMLYVEFSADKDADLNDRRQWAVANPSYPHRTGEAAILRMKKNLGDDSFRREGLGIWDETTVSSAINPKLWVRGNRGRWEAKRIVTNWPEPTAIPFISDPQLSRPLGRARITRPLMALTDMGFRTLVRMEASAEFYSVPKLWFLGAPEDAFNQNTWSSLVSAINAIDGDIDGKNPELHQISQSSMQPNSDMLKTIALVVAAETNLPADNLGITLDNPTSAEAMAAAERKLTREADR